MVLVQDIDIGRGSRAEAIEEVFIEEKLGYKEEQKSRKKVILNIYY